MSDGKSAQEIKQMRAKNRDNNANWNNTTYTCTAVQWLFRKQYIKILSSNLIFHCEYDSQLNENMFSFRVEWKYFFI